MLGQIFFVKHNILYVPQLSTFFKEMCGKGARHKLQKFYNCRIKLLQRRIIIELPKGGKGAKTSFLGNFVRGDMKKRRLGFYQAITVLGYIVGTIVCLVLGVCTHLHPALCIVIAVAIGGITNFVCWACHRCPYCNVPLGIYRRMAFKKCPHCGNPLDDNM